MTDQHSDNRAIVHRVIYPKMALLVILISSMPAFVAAAVANEAANPTEPVSAQSEPAQPLMPPSSSRPPKESYSTTTPVTTRPSETDLGPVLNAINQLRNDLDKKPDLGVMAIIGLCSALIGALVSLLAVFIKEKAEERRAIRNISLQAMDRMMAWRLKQIEKLYGPLNALMRQSHGVYQQLCKFLHDHQAPGAKSLQWVTDAKSTGRKSLEVYEDGEWIPFRLLDQLPKVYDTNSNAGPLIDEVMLVGESMVKIIHEHAGLGLSHQPLLQGLFGDYLAHFVVLNEMYKAVRVPGTDPAVLRQRYVSGYFPRELPKVIAEGLNEISGELGTLERELARLAHKNEHPSPVASHG